MQEPISMERLSELVGLIYDAAIDPACWPLAMDAIRMELNFHNSTMNIQQLPSGRVLTNVTCNIDPQYLPTMEVAGPDVIEQWGGKDTFMSLPLDQPGVLTRINPQFDFNTTTNRYYLDFAKPQRIIDVLAIGLARDERAFGSLAFGRHESAGPIGEREIAVAAMLIPHVQRAATINRMLDAAALERASFAAALDALSVPVALVGWEGRVVHANPAAWRILDRGYPLRLRNGVLDARGLGVSRALAVAIAQAQSDESGLARRGLGIPLRGGDAVAGALHVLPLRAGRIGTETGAVAAVFVAQADTPFIAPTEVIAALFDLSPAEARVFTLIAEGTSITDAAIRLDIKRSTARTHLLHIYAKIGVKRQSDLVRIAASLALPVVES